MVGKNNPFLGVTQGYLENSRCDVHVHQFETPKASNPVAYQKWYFPMFSKYDQGLLAIGFP